MAKPEPDQMDAGNLAVSEDQVRTALNRMIANPAFGANEQRTEFLRFVVEEALAGRGRDLKGFTIAQAVFDRDESFDARSDPVVRIEARRLRQNLDSYYVGPGAEDPLRITIPKGGYTPYFEVRNSFAAQPSMPQAPEPKADARRTFQRIGRHWMVMATAAVVLAVLAAALPLLSRTDEVAATEASVSQYPRVAILPFEPLDPSGTTRTLSLGLSSELVLKLRAFGNMQLYAPLVASDLQRKLPELGADGVPAYVVRGTVVIEGEQVAVTVELLSGTTDELVWGDKYGLDLAPGSLIELRDTVSAEIAAALGQPYGPLTGDIKAHSRHKQPRSLESYLCVLQGYSYRRTFDAAAYEPTRACLEQAVARSPDYATAWAMLGFLALDAARYRLVAPEQVEAESAKALEAAERAYLLAPDNTLAANALSAIHHHIGNYAEAERYGRIALELNPYDPETLAQVGWRLSVRGKFEEGGPLMEEAIRRTVDPPGWYYHVLSLQHFMQGNPELALEEAELAASKGTSFAWFLVAINAAALGDADKAALALEAFADHPSVAADPEDFMRRHGTTDKILNSAMAGFREAERLVSARERPGRKSGD